MEMIQDRKDLPALLKEGGIGIEIGVDSGNFSYHILEYSKLKVLFSVDPWSAACPMFADQEAADRSYIYACFILRRWGDRSMVLRLSGERAAAEFSTRFFDFIYIDSDHSYETTKKQLELYYPLLADDGIFAGHDYVNGDEVRRAVDEFAYNAGLRVETTVQDSGWDFPVNSWILRK